MDKFRWLAAGAVLGVVSFLACGDAIVQRVDAGLDAPVQCNCPASEPPLAGRIVQRSETGNWSNGGGFAIVNCASSPFEGGILLGGKCSVNFTSLGTVQGTVYPRLTQVGFCPNSPQEYCCSIEPARPDDDSSGTVTAVAICLYPEGRVPPDARP